MEGILRHRQLRIWEAVCMEYKIPAKKKVQISEWILEGKIYEEASRRYMRNFSHHPVVPNCRQHEPKCRQHESE
jgi:hypothetical protein